MYRAKLPRPTVELIRSMQNVGEILDATAVEMEKQLHRAPRAVACARVCAATCYQAAHRIKELATLVEEIAPIVDTQKTPRARKTPPGDRGYFLKKRGKA
jgi:hypothetical protein